MGETDKLYEEVKRIRWHQEAMDGSLELLVRAEREKLIPAIMEVFGTAKRRARVYLSIDGQSSVQQLVERLNISQPNISIEIGKLRDGGLLQIIKDDDGRGKYYKKKRIDELLGISSKLRKTFDLDEQGNPLSGEVKPSSEPINVPEETNQGVDNAVQP